MMRKVATKAGWSNALHRYPVRLALLVVGWVALAGCSPRATQTMAVTDADERPPFTDVLSPDCMEYALVEGRLANLAKQSMSVYGRIDPGIFYAPTADTLAVTEGLAAEPEFQKAFEEVSKDPKALLALSRGFAEATKHCGQTGCPPSKYAIKIFEARPPAGNDHFYQWVVSGDELPNVVQWRGFGKLYASRPALCYVLPSLQVRTRASGYLITDSPFAPEEPEEPGEGHALAASDYAESSDSAAVRSHGNPCKCKFGDVALTGSCTPCAASLLQCYETAQE